MPAKSEAILLLTAIALDDNRKKYPNFPDDKRYFKPYSDKTEKGLIHCITDFLKFKGHQGERIDNKGTRIDDRQVVENVIGQMKTIGRVRWNYSQQERGTADVSATIKRNFAGVIIGCSVKIEIKIGNDTQKPHQKLYQQKVEAAGGFYWIVKSFNDFLERYEEFVTN